MNQDGAQDLLGTIIDSDEQAMYVALELAQRAYALGEVPVGALVVLDGKVIGQGFNQPITTLDPSAHAEMIAVRQAALTIGNYRLPNATLYVTVEPCTMCTGLLIHSRLARIVFGATEPKAGAMVSALTLPQEPFYNHVMEIKGSVLAQECANLMSNFFAERRAAKKKLKGNQAK